MRRTVREVAREMIRTIPMAAGAIKAEFRAAADGHAQPEQMRILWLLKHGSLTAGQIGGALRVSLPTVSKAVAVLERNGWVTRERDPVDRRKVTVRITEAGSAEIAVTRDFAVARLADTLDGLSDEDLTTLSEGLAVLAEAFSSHEHAYHRHGRGQPHEIRAADKGQG